MIAMHVTDWRYLDEKEREAVEKKNRRSFRETLDQICLALDRAAISYQRKDYPKRMMEANPWSYECGHLAMVDGYEIAMYLKIVVPREHGRAEYANKWYMKSAIRIQLGSRSASAVRFVEGKKGFDYDKIAREIMEWIKNQRENNENRRRHLAEKEKLDEIVESLNEKYAVKGAFTSAGWTSRHPMAEPGSNGLIKVCLPDMTAGQAEEVLAFAKKLGL